MNENKQGHQKIITHLGWIIFILSLVIIVLFSVKIGSDDQIKDIIGTSLALGSLILALLAIIQTIVSGQNTNNMMHALSEKIASIQGPADDIAESAKLLSTYSDSILETSKRIEQSSSPNAPASNEQAHIFKEPTDFNTLKATTTIGGLAAYYLCVRSHEEKRGFNPLIVFREPEISARYMQGFIAAIRSTGALSIDRDGNEFIVRDLKKWDWLPEIKQHAANQQRLKKYKVAIDRYFDA